MDAIEQEIQAKGLTAPRVRPEDVEAAIISEHYFTPIDALVHDGGWPEGMHESLGLLTFCVLVLRNGFTVTGEGACASPENFDAELGRKIARQNAVAKIWPLLGYALRDKLHAVETAIPPEPGAADPKDCPHAAPFRYCQRCVADPCPIGLGSTGA